MTQEKKRARQPAEKGPSPGISGLDQVARVVLRSRLLDDLEESELAPRGEVPYQFSARGHELPQVLLGLELTHPHDGATVYYRSRAFMLTVGLSMTEAIAAGMARASSPSQGRDVGVVFSMPPRGGPTVLPSSGDVGAQFTPAAGWAQAIRYRAEVVGDSAWSGAIAVALGGDGSVATNGFWAALVIATTQKLPLLFMIEDNGYGLSVPARFHTPNGNIAANLLSFGGLKVLDGSGVLPIETTQLVHEAVSYVREGRGPCLLRVRVPRLSGHTFIDNQAYKTELEREEEAARDPLKAIEALLGSDRYAALREEAREEVAAALQEARGQPAPDPASATRHLFFEGEPPLVGGAVSWPDSSSGSTSKGTRHRTSTGPFAGGAEDVGEVAKVRGAEEIGGVAEVGGSAMADRPQKGARRQARRINLIDAVRQVLEAELEVNPRMVLFGEDVGAKGGVHGATVGLQHRLGAERVFDTSLSEEGIIGRAVGMALAGLLPVPEIQFRKYADPATEQINDCGTIRWRTAGRFAAPMVVRIPVGYGKKTGDPWHSVCGEAIYAHTPGWRLAFPSNAADAAGLLRTALRGQDPTFFFEHRALLDTAAARRPAPGHTYIVPFGRAAMARAGTDLTLVTWGAMVYPALEAAARFGDRVEVLDLRTIVPWDREGVLASVRKTSRCLVVHEDLLTGGFGAEIVAVVADEAFLSLDAPLRRLAVPDCPIPYNHGMMDAVLPGVDSIAEEIDRLLTF